MADLKTLGAYLGLEEEDFRELTQLFLETAQEDITKMETTFTSGDARGVMEAAHRLKGAAGNLGFAAIAEKAGDAERQSNAGDLAGMEGLLETLKSELDQIRHLL